MRVLVTRPTEDGRSTIARLEALGVAASLCPLLEIELLPIAASSLRAATSIVATSRNALRALKASPDALAVAKHKPIFVVGPGSAEAAKSLGLQNVSVGAGRANELAPVVAASSPQGSTVAVLCGDVSAFDMPAALQSAGFNVVRISAYQSMATKALAAGLVNQLSAGHFDAVILMSPRSALTWASLTMNQDIDVASLVHICLSSQVAGALPADFIHGKVLVAERPNLDELLFLTKRLADSAASR